MKMTVQFKLCTAMMLDFHCTAMILDFHFVNLRELYKGVYLIWKNEEVIC